MKAGRTRPADEFFDELLGELTDRVAGRGLQKRALIGVKPVRFTVSTLPITEQDIREIALFIAERSPWRRLGLRPSFEQRSAISL